MSSISKYISHHSVVSGARLIRRALSRALPLRSPTIVATAILGAASSTISAQSIGYSIVPGAARIQWNDRLAFSDEWLYGGRVSVRFGSAIELQPFYFTGKNYGIDGSRAPTLFGPRSNGRSIDLQHYGLSAQLNLSRGSVVPFLRGGGGVLRFEPDSGRRQDRLAVTAGGGIRFGIGQLQAELFAEQLGFRLDPLRLFSGDSVTGGRSARQNNLVYGGAVSVPLSVPQDSAEESGLRGATAPIEPFVGRLRYAGSAGLRDQNLVGIRAGIDFSPLFGVRGFYWRGVNEDRDQFVSVEGYGAEGQFNLNTGPGISPYVIAGAGRITYSGTYRDSLSNNDKSRNALILGAGAAFQLSERVKFNAALRDYVIARNDSIEAVSTSGDLTHNRMLTAGFTISIGGSSGVPERSRDIERERLSARRRTDRRDAEMRMVGDSVRRVRRDRRMGADSGGRFITVPVPTHGEVILRYGFPPARSAGDTVKGTRSEGTRDTVLVYRDSTTSRRPLDPTTDSLRQQLSRLEQRLASMELLTATPALNAPITRRTVVLDTVGADTILVQRYRGLALSDRFRQASPRDIRPFVGVSAGNAGTQGVLSLRMDLGAMTSGLQFVPELAVGVGGDGTSVLALANVQYRFQSIGGTTALRPYVTGGVGIFSPTVLGINTAFGTSVDVRRGKGNAPWLGYLELQGLNLFRDTRVMVGLSRR